MIVFIKLAVYDVPLLTIVNEYVCCMPSMDYVSVYYTFAENILAVDGVWIMYPGIIPLLRIC